MKRVGISVWMVGVTLAASLMMRLFPGMIANALPTETPAQVTLATVQLGSVEQVLALTGRLRYASEYAALSPGTGVVEQVCVRIGDRVEEGNLLFRLDGDAQEKALSALLTAHGAEAMPGGLREAAALLEGFAVRAAASGVVHQVSVAEHGGVTAGMPAVTLSTGGQQIVCSAVMRDAAEVRTGMTARISREEEFLCHASVVSVGALETDMTTGQTVSKITLEPQETLTFPLGTALEVEIILAESSDVPVLPVEAMDDEGMVWWVADGRCYRTDAGVILADEMQAWVALPEGTDVVLSGDVTEGQKIRGVKR